MQSIIDRLLTVTTVLRTAGVVILALVGITVLFIIINTIRLAVIARASEIEIMRLVGASDAFVRWPFIFEGALVGLFGSLITLALFGLAAEPLNGVMTGFFQVLPLELGSLTRDVVVLDTRFRAGPWVVRGVALGAELSQPLNLRARVRLMPGGAWTRSIAHASCPCGHKRDDDRSVWCHISVTRVLGASAMPRRA